MLSKTCPQRVVMSKRNKIVPWDGNGEARIGRKDSSLRLCMTIVRLSIISCMMELSSRDRIDQS